MDSGPTDEQYLDACASGVPEKQRPQIRAMIAQYEAQKAMNRAAEQATYTNIMAAIQAAKGN